MYDIIDKATNQSIQSIHQSIHPSINHSHYLFHSIIPYNIITYQYNNIMIMIVVVDVVTTN